jgi:hypothetical protein
MSHNGTLIFGKTSAGVNQPVLVGNDGALVAGLTVGDITLGTVSINQTTPGTTNGVVINSSALPSGAATQTTLAAILAKILTAPATEAKQDTEITKLTSIDTKMSACNTGAVVIASSALPSGAASETTLGALNTKVTACNTGAVVVASGSITANTATMSIASSSTYEASKVVKAGAGTLFNLSGYNSGPAQWLQLYNSTTLPANGVAPILLLAVPAQSTFSFDWTKGIPCSTGIVIGNSSTGPTKTIGSTDCYFTASYV